jgi:Putative metallopeptidase
MKTSHRICRSVPDGSLSRTPRLARLGYALLLVLGLGTGPLFAQAAPPAAQSQEVPPPGSFAERVTETVRALVETSPRLKRFPPEKRKAMVEFVFGNILFVSAHELGHGVLAEFELPNLGHDEDAADNFAILTIGRVGTSFSERVLIEAIKGWYLADLRDKATGEKPEYYGAHGMNLQRAYQIVCMMVGWNQEKFKELADIAKMPEDRQRSCKTDFTFTALSWETLLKPRVRAPDQPKQKIELIYGEAKGPLAPFAKAFRDIKFLETISEAVGDRYAWPQPFVMEMVECGEVGANWRSRKLKICYEMAQEFAELYRDYGDKLGASRRQQKKGKKKS